jgi:hypothetical protein
MASFRIDFGKPIQQIRELIKDLWYRNRHEQKMADIELKERQLRFEETKSRFASNINSPNPILQTNMFSSQQLRVTSSDRITAIEPGRTNIVTIEQECSEDTTKPSIKILKRRTPTKPK